VSIESVTIVPASNVADVRRIVVEAGLPADDLGGEGQRFLVARSGDAIVGCVGLELAGQAALLRSLAVAPSWRGKGLGMALYEAVLALARREHVTELWLLTTTAEGFFAARGFTVTSRDDAPRAVRGSAEFAALCPATAVCMCRRLG